MRKYLLGVLAVVFASSAAAGIYKWVDANGVTHYSEQPPAGAQAHEVQVSPPPPGPAAGGEPAEAGAGAPAAPGPEAAKGDEAGQERLARSRAVQCAQVRDTLQSLRRDAPVFQSSPAGEQVLLTNEERAAALEKWGKFEEKYCKPAQ